MFDEDSFVISKYEGVLKLDLILLKMSGLSMLVLKKQIQRKLTKFKENISVLLHKTY